MAQKHSKEMFASDELMLGNRKYVNTVMVMDGLYCTVSDMLKDFDGVEWRNEVNEEKNEDNLCQFAADWEGVFRPMLFVVRPEFIDEGRCLDPRVNEHDLTLADKLMEIIKEYYSITQK